MMYSPCHADPSLNETSALAASVPARHGSVVRVAGRGGGLK